MPWSSINYEYIGEPTHYNIEKFATHLTEEVTQFIHKHIAFMLLA